MNPIQTEHGDGSECFNSCHDPRCIRGHGHYPDSIHSDGVTYWPDEPHHPGTYRPFGYDTAWDAEGRPYNRESVR